MREIGVLEAKTNLSNLLAEVEASGESFAITRHGKRVAHLTPARDRPWSEIVEDTIRWRDDMARKNPKLAEPYDLRADRDSIE